MSALLRDRAGRFIAGTAAVGSLADWTLFAVLVVAVDAATQGSAWATSAVLAAKIVPAILFAPLAARWSDRLPLRASLLGHEVLRVAAVAVIALGAARADVAIALGGIVVFEYGAAMLAASRESYLSRHVARSLFARLNTITAVLGYGLLPAGAFVVDAAGGPAAWVVALTGYAVVAASYLRLPLPERPGTVVVEETRDGVRRRLDGPVLRAVLAAGIGLIPVVMLFSVLPRLAEGWLGSATATGTVTAIALAGGAVGFWLANRGTRAEPGLALSAAGLAVAATGTWQVGVVLLGVGAGLAYLALQTRLQTLAQDPSQFATAFAVLKGCAAVATLAGPALFGRLGVEGTLGVAAVVAAASLVVAGGLRWTLQRVLKGALHLAVAVDVRGAPVEGGAVVVSNHPHLIDGAVAKLADESLRPVARWQRNPFARAAIWIADCVVTTARTDRAHRPAFAEALEHLRAGGRIWLAPEGASHAEPVLRAPRTGAVRMAAAAGVPLQALGIVHDRPTGPRPRDWRPWRRPRVTLVWGSVVHTSANVAADCDRMMQAIADASGTVWVPQREGAAA